MKNEMPDEIWAGFGWDQKVLSAGAWYSEPLKDHQHRYTKTDLTDRRTDVDALIEAVEEMLIGLEGALFEDAEQKRVKGLEAIQAIRGKRDE